MKDLIAEKCGELVSWFSRSEEVPYNIVRAQVIETNDPLNIGRVRIKCPELHDSDLKPEDCPWASPCFSFGGKRAGSYHSLCIGDWVWITFEKNSPYSILWVGAATPTRRKLYPYAFIHSETPVPVDEDGNPQYRPEDYDIDYLPKDNRPMVQMVQDRYGNIDLMSSVGFFPIEHEEEPAPQDYDPFSGDQNRDLSLPEVNNPDVKYMLRMSKYGNFLLLSDHGYYWKLDDDKGEFKGDAEEDEEFEKRRWAYIRTLIEEGEPQGDNRRILLQSRYGSRLEIRDTGWNKSRIGEYSDAKQEIGTGEDQRWVKLRSKGGMLFQQIDIGFDEDDEWVNRLPTAETGTTLDNEDSWGGDGRQQRQITRYGLKFVLDDRGSHTKRAQDEEEPRPYGVLIKTRRTPGSKSIKQTDNPKGYFLELAEKDEANQGSLGSPAGIVLQLSDKDQCAMLVARLPDYPKQWAGRRDNEFLSGSLADNDAHKSTHHLMIDHTSEMIRLKTRANRGAKPLISSPATVKDGEQQGIECRDLDYQDSPWCEVNDIHDRGIWFWGKQRYVICRAAQKGENPRKIYWWFGEDNKEFVLANNEPIDDTRPRIQIFCTADVEIIADENVSVYGKKEVLIRGDKRVVIQGADNGLVEVLPDRINTNKTIYAAGFAPFTGTIYPLSAPIKADDPPQLMPNDRGERWIG